MSLFDRASYPTSVPAALVAGDLWAWRIAQVDTSYTLSYALTPLAGGTPIVIDAVYSDGWSYVEVDSETTADYDAGRYSWTEYATRTSDSARARTAFGHLTVAPDPTVSIADTRSHAQRTLDAIEAVIEGRASTDQQAYTIQGRSLQRTPMADLLMLRERYAAEVRSERLAEAAANGTGRRNRNVVVRMA